MPSACVAVHHIYKHNVHCAADQRPCQSTPKNFEVGKGGASQPWTLMSEDDDDDSIPIEIQDAVGQKVMENRG